MQALDQAADDPSLNVDLNSAVDFATLRPAAELGENLEQSFVGTAYQIIRRLCRDR